MSFGPGDLPPPRPDSTSKAHEGGSAPTGSWRTGRPTVTDESRLGSPPLPSGATDEKTGPHTTPSREPNPEDRVPVLNLASPHRVGRDLGRAHPRNYPPTLGSGPRPRTHQTRVGGGY